VPNQTNPGPYALEYPTLQPPLIVFPGQVISYPTLLSGLQLTQNSPTVPPVDSLTRVTVTGTLTTDSGGYQVGAVRFIPVLYSASGHYIYAGAALVAALVAGQFSIPLPGTDDPATITPGFVYLVLEPSGAQYLINVPIASPGGTLDLATCPHLLPTSAQVVTSVNGQSGAVTGLATKGAAIALAFVLGS
jgi:hypothetical protein